MFLFRELNSSFKEGEFFIKIQEFKSRLFIDSSKDTDF